MKVTLIGPAYPLRGGIAHHVFRLHQELTRRGHSVQVISFKRLYPGFLFPGKTTADTSEQKLDAGAVALLDPLNPLTWFLGFRTVRKFAPDLVIVQWWNTFFAPVTCVLCALLAEAGIKVLIECHNVFPHERKWFDFALACAAFMPVKRFIVHSEADRESLRSIIQDGGVTVAPLPPIGEFRGSPRLKRDGRNILFFGLVRKYKGLDVLLRAMPRVLARFDCRLRIAGEFYDAVDRYERLIKELGIGSRVEIDNRYVPNEEVAGLFEWADVLVLPYLSATQSGVAQIAFSNGLPIIASKTGGLSDVISDHVNGLFFSAGDEKGLADAIISYFADGLGPLFATNIRSAKPAARDLFSVLLD